MAGATGLGVEGGVGVRFLPFDKTQDNFHSAEIAVFPFAFLGSKTPLVKKTAARTVKTAKTLDLNPRVGVGKTLRSRAEGSARRKVDSDPPTPCGLRRAGRLPVG